MASGEVQRAYRRAVYAVDRAFGELFAALEFYKAGFNPNQPRVPSGNRDGGQWTEGGGGGNVDGWNRRPQAVPEKDPDAIEPVYLLESILPGLAPARRLYLAWRGWNYAEAEWTLGPHKSPTKWANQLRSRNWTPKDIDDTLRYGKKYPAPNKVNPENGATRYEYNGRYLVRDNKTKGLLQVSGNKFVRTTLP